MRFAGDFHIHSKYSRATSPQMNLEDLDKWAKIKGINVLGTGDFTHPAWFKNLEEKLQPAEPGLYKLQDIGSPSDFTRFVLSAEISCIYSKGGKIRKVHIVLLAPSFEATKKINKALDKIGNLKADGRPILGLDAKELLKVALDADENCMVIPAHAWTPWFAIFGSKSGFDSVEECFDDCAKYIYALETGLSADPKIFWRISNFDKFALLSNSDSHSPQKIGREANIFDAELSYAGIAEAIKTKDKDKFLYTVEFFPEEGKYHYDGHKDCGISLSPKQSQKYNNNCPVCSRPLTIGVLNRAEVLSDRPDGFVPQNAIPFKSLIPLQEIIAESLGVSVSSKQVGKFYEKLISSGNELEILLDKERGELEKIGSAQIAEGIIRAREGKVNIEPGYDGVYGKISLFSEKEKAKNKILQKTLF